MTLQPLNNNVLIKPAPKAEATKSGIVLPESSQPNGPERGEVLALGAGKLLDNGTRAAMAVKVGDQVMFKRSYSSEEVDLDGVKYFLVNEADILGIIN